MGAQPRVQNVLAGRPGDVTRDDRAPPPVDPVDHPLDLPHRDLGEIPQPDQASAPVPHPEPLPVLAERARGHHVAVRVQDFEVAKRWYMEKLDARVVHEWPYADEQLAYLALPNDDHFMVELLGGGDPAPSDAPSYRDLGESLSHAGYHHFCISVADIEATVAELKTRGVAIVTEPFQLDAISRNTYGQSVIRAMIIHSRSET